MERTFLELHSKYSIAEVSPWIFGGFLEHLGRSIYEGVFDPGSAHADDDGMRTDVIDALAELEMTIVRYPGGNFTSGYHWEDGVGPTDERPTVRELAWQSLEPNTFGTDEFISLCRKLNWQPMLAVNLGTGTPEEARNWLEYCNAPVGSRYADLRRANGSTDPHHVPVWCLGNEMDGPWQIGHVPAEHYAIRAQQAAKMMRDTDRTIVTVACGSSSPAMPTYLEWDRTVLEHLGSLADYVSLHRYVGNESDDTADFLALSASIDAQIESVDACARFVQAKRKSKQRAYLCFDEWNVWYRARGGAYADGQGKFAPPLLEEVYNVEDALVVGLFLNSFIRHADVVKIANLAQLVNVIGPILTRGDELLKQSIFYAFRMISTRKHGISLRPQVDGPSYASASHGDVTFLDASAILDGNQLHVFAINRDLETHMPLTVRLADGAMTRVVSSEILTGAPKAANSFEDPDVVRAVPFDGWSVDGTASADLPPVSLTATTFELG